MIKFAILEDLRNLRKIMFLRITSRRMELEGRATSQIVGNSNAILNLSNFFKIDKELTEIFPSEVDRTITKFLGGISSLQILKICSIVKR